MYSVAYSKTGKRLGINSPQSYLLTCCSLKFNKRPMIHDAQLDPLPDETSIALWIVSMKLSNLSLQCHILLKFGRYPEKVLTGILPRLPCFP